MTIEKLERVMWRLRKLYPGVNHPKPTNAELRRAIMYECGTSPVTYRRNRKSLIDLGWLRTFNKVRTRMTNNDLTGD